MDCISNNQAKKVNVGTPFFAALSASIQSVAKKPQSTVAKKPQSKMKIIVRIVSMFRLETQGTRKQANEPHPYEYLELVSNPVRDSSLPPIIISKITNLTKEAYKIGVLLTETIQSASGILDLYKK